MMNHRYKSWGILVLVLLLVPTTNAQVSSDDVGTDKLAQTSFKFLSISPDARAAAMADAMTAVETRSSVAMFYNPAGMARLNGQFSANAGFTEWIADIQYNVASAAFSPMNGRYGVFGVSLIFADYGDDFIGTFKSGEGYTEYSEVGLSNPEPGAMAVGLGYAMAITDRFAVGGNAKYVSQDLGDAAISYDGSSATTVGNEESTVAFDFGVLYNTGFRSLDIAMTVRNFAQELSYVNENFELPLTFNVGATMDMMDLTAMDPNLHSFQIAVAAQRPRDFSEQLRVGGEYTFMNLLSLRAGYTTPSDLVGLNVGAGLNYEYEGVGAIGINYSWSQSKADGLGDVQRLGASIAF